MFDRYFPLMKALHVDLLSRRHQFSSFTDSVSAARMVSPTRIMLVFPLLCNNASLVLSVTGSFYKTYFDEVWHNIIPGDGRSSHSSVGIPIMRLHDLFLNFINVFCSPPSGGLFPDFSCFIFLNSSATFKNACNIFIA